jgi:hypothetical protein
MGRRRAATGGRHVPGRGDGDECEDVDTNPVNRENGVCPAQVWPADRRRAATGGRHSLSRCDGDECEDVDLNPVNREDGVHPHERQDKSLVEEVSPPPLAGGAGPASHRRIFARGPLPPTPTLKGRGSVFPDPGLS